MPGTCRTRVRRCAPVEPEQRAAVGISSALNGADLDSWMLTLSGTERDVRISVDSGVPMPASSLAARSARQPSVHPTQLSEVPQNGP
jgi:hypothetical protein